LEREGSLADVAKKIGTNRMSLFICLKNEELPPRRMSTMASVFDWSPELVKAILDRNESLGFWKRKCEKLEQENKRLRTAITAFALEE